MKTTEIPADRAANGPDAILADLTSQRTADLIQEAAKSAPPAGSEARKVGDYYASYMDEAGIEAKGLAPLRPTLDRIAAIGGPRGPGPHPRGDAAGRTWTRSTPPTCTPTTSSGCGWRRT
jgi:putative endopeptidase